MDEPVMRDYACRDGYTMRPVPAGQNRAGTFCGQCQHGPRMGDKCLFHPERRLQPWLEPEQGAERACPVCGEPIGEGSTLCRQHSGELIRLSDRAKKGLAVDTERLAVLCECVGRVAPTGTL